MEEEIELSQEEYDQLQEIVDELRADGYTDEQINAVVDEILGGDAAEEITETDVNGDGDTDVTAVDKDNDGKADEVKISTESKKEGEDAAEKAADKLGDDNGKLDSTGNVSDDNDDKKDDTDGTTPSDKDVKKLSHNQKKAESQKGKWGDWKKGDYGFGGTVSDEECKERASDNARKIANMGNASAGAPAMARKLNHADFHNRQPDDEQRESQADEQVSNKGYRGTMSDATMKNIIGALYDKRF